MPAQADSKIRSDKFTPQGGPKKMSLSVFELKSVLGVGFDFSGCVLESEFEARFI